MNLPSTRPADPDLAKQVADLKRQLAESQREFDETRQLWTVERRMLEEKAKQDLEQTRESSQASISTEVLQLKAAHAAELEELRAAHAAELTTLREDFEVELAELRGTADLSNELEQTFAGERQRMQSQLEDARSEALREASEREQIYAQEAEEVAQSHTVEVARRDEQIVVLQQEIAALKLRCATLEGESNRWALERLRFITHLEEGLLLLGAARPDDDDQLDIEVRPGDDSDDDE